MTTPNRISTSSPTGVAGRRVTRFPGTVDCPGSRGRTTGPTHATWTAPARSPATAYPRGVFGNLGAAHLIVLLFAALFILGPERLPGAVASVARAVRQVQQYATGAKAQLKDELGPDFDALRKPLADLQQLRGTSAKSLITQHLFDGDATPFTMGNPAPVPGNPVSMAKSKTFDPVSPSPRLGPGEHPPYDPDAT
jgi:sec-independent protein translocase protein TatB